MCGRRLCGGSPSGSVPCVRGPSSAAYRSAVPLALVSDIHGNDVALAAVVAELERLGIDQVVCLGDTAQGGPQPSEVLDRLAALDWPVVLGNRDAFLLRIPEQTA